MSKSRAWMALDVGDFIVDTMHLNATETGIYIRLIVHCWQHGSIPLDDHKLALISHCNPKVWHQYRKTVLQFFDFDTEVSATHKRVSSELRRSEEISNKRKAAALQKHSNSSANVVQLHPQAQAHLDSSKEEESKIRVIAKKATDYSDEFQRFWTEYPRRPSMSKKEAWQEWKKLAPDKRRDACQALGAYRNEKFILDACRYLKRETFQGYVNGGDPIVVKPDVRNLL